VAAKLDSLKTNSFFSRGENILSDKSFANMMEFEQIGTKVDLHEDEKQ